MQNDLNNCNWIKPLSLTGQYVTLLPLAVEHCDELIEAVKDGELWKLWYTTIPAPQNMRNEIKRRLDLQVQMKMLPFTVVDNNSGMPVGMTSYYNIDTIVKRVEIGSTWYRKSAQKTALNTEAKLLLLAHAFEILECVAVEFRTSFFNHNSRRAIERLGAKFDGVLRNHRILQNGMVGDTCTYSILNSEWGNVKTNLQLKLRSY